MAENGAFGGREVVIVEAARLPVGRGHEEKGYYKDAHASNLLAKSYGAVIERAGIEPSEVEDVVAGCVQQFGEQGINIARNAWLEAGLPIETPATTVDRQCGSAQQAVNFAAALVASGVHDVAIGGGVEHMGHISFADSAEVMKEHGFAFSPQLLERNGMTVDDIDLFEVNEAFAPVVLAWQRELQPDMDRVNVNGGAMALGHPLGSTGARLLTTLLHELERSDKETGMVTMCCGGGLGTGTIIQRV